MITATVRELEQAGITEQPMAVVADSGYWNEQHMDQAGEAGIPVLIPPDSRQRNGERPGWTGGRYRWMRRLLKTNRGDELYRKRAQLVEPVYGHAKHNRQFRRVHRKGRTAVRTDWRLLMATHNLTKLHKHQRATHGPEQGPTATTATIPGRNLTAGPHDSASGSRSPKALRDTRASRTLKEEVM